jgi:hypothetical protein
MFEWFGLTGGCLSTNGCLLFWLFDHWCLVTRVSQLEERIHRIERQENRADINRFR